MLEKKRGSFHARDLLSHQKKVKERQKGKERKVFKGSVWNAVRSDRSTESTRAEREGDQSYDGSNYVSNGLGTEPLLAATGSLTTCRLDKGFIAQKLLIYCSGGFSVIASSSFVLDISPKVQTIIRKIETNEAILACVKSIELQNYGWFWKCNEKSLNLY